MVRLLNAAADLVAAASIAATIYLALALFT